MNVSLISLSRYDNRSYRVSLGDASGEVKTFILRVEEADNIRHVTWQDDFAAYFNQNLAHASVIFEATLAFDRARELTRPADP